MIFNKIPYKIVNKIYDCTRKKIVVSGYTRISEITREGSEYWEYYHVTRKYCEPNKDIIFTVYELKAYFYYLFSWYKKYGMTLENKFPMIITTCWNDHNLNNASRIDPDPYRAEGKKVFTGLYIPPIDGTEFFKSYDKGFLELCANEDRELQPSSHDNEIFIIFLDPFMDEYNSLSKEICSFVLYNGREWAELFNYLEVALDMDMYRPIEDDIPGIEIADLPKPTNKAFTEDSCVICLSEKPNIIFCNCGHLCICNTCNENYKKDKCPICKKVNEIKIKL